MADENKKPKSNSKAKKRENSIKRPQTAYFLFCQEKREEFKKKGDESKLTAKELGAMWKNLSESKKSHIKNIMKKRKENMIGL